MELETRLGKIRPLSEQVDAILLCSGTPNFFYFTEKELSGSFFYYDFSKPCLLTNAMELGRASGWIKDINEIGGFDDIIRIARSGRVGIDAAGMNADMYEKIKKISNVIDISAYLEKARAVKTTYEISRIKKACKAAECAFAYVREGVAESALAATLEYKIKMQTSSVAFPAIVAAGKNMAVPHHTPGKTMVKSPFLVDIGCRWDGYCSDITRAYGSKYAALIESVFKKIEDMLVPGVAASALDNAARSVLGSKAKFFITSLGHGIGISVHESPAISSKSKDTLVAGMTFTIEPGIYVKNGIRIENDYLMTKGGFKNLSDF